eukprot:gnl/MRDRNA2_/MRDRNA2_100397_c0_seq1.p1 gnl/MRDRNA2_/MRDRNA2_100397_c0~~gnl/MRDRNA2_/MRDRNA2_100397_c0_seq1.p1  ORF type:complete len:181 (-),score=30.17 gnl/MRDRNA2_/MRDRNA2_100397_c0_seq1:267-809(-)
MLSGSYCILTFLFTSALATRTTMRVTSLKAGKDVAAGLRGVSEHREGISFANFLTRAMHSDAFKKQAAQVVPYMCDDPNGPSPDNELCRKSITKSLLCLNFLEKAKSLQQEKVAGADNFVARCKALEGEVPDLRSVVHMVQNPQETFNNVLSKAEVDTGVKLSGAMATLDQVSGKKNNGR